MHSSFFTIHRDKVAFKKFLYLFRGAALISTKLQNMFGFNMKQDGRHADKEETVF